MCFLYHCFSYDHFRYDVRVRPIQDHTKPLKVHISISLYQIIHVDEPAQNIKLNVWMIQKWKDEYLTWDPREYGMINSTIIPFRYLWIPDTYLYNSPLLVPHIVCIQYLLRVAFSVKMSRDETERYMNIQVESQYWKGENGSQLSFLYPAIYTITCRLNIRFFPYDRQNCTLTISSWTNSMSALDYYADPEVNLASFIPNEEWDVKSFKIFRHEYKYACCAEPWAILQASLVIQRKPLYYIVNLIVPTSIITIVSITGFFTPASTDDDRTEKINLGEGLLELSSMVRHEGRKAQTFRKRDDPLNAWRRRRRSPSPTLQKTDSLYIDRTPISPTPLERQSTLRLPRQGLDRFSSIQMIDISVPPSPAMSRISRTPSTAQSQKPTLWEGTISALAGTNTQLRRTSAAFSKEVDAMRRKRQCSLEWEFLATVLDRMSHAQMSGPFEIVGSERKVANSLKSQEVV
ncbi:Neurotransmitter-gated ion-channel ligand binding domain protein [Teladorsagia circumcincta]|uniref:Neurotransmitter-gated ion-channel ligand binding domain protein n=2 Tax=Teladorsagia circumcincta TaxID=45464 RepID=A0A2G9UAG1_TELCI|nr:Neurotransmitter-gated ion-channel ligand binding domain protein [Teladorsagia circumcincta]